MDKYSLEDAKNLITIARNAIISTWEDAKTSTEFNRRYNIKQGVFVTLSKKGELRGCIGFVLPHYSIFEGIIHCAKAAAFEDPRFQPVTKPEMKDISIDISILTIPQEIKAKSKSEILKKIKIGKDGLIVKRGFYSGLLLPQVFTEYNATPEQALEMTCEKAGLPADAWKDEKTLVEYFSAQVFKEQSPSGKIIEEKLR